METTTNPEAKMNTSESIEARMWDSEKRNSPYSTVADPNEDDYCESCDSPVDYSDGSPHGTCKCGAAHEETDEEYYAAMAALGYKRAA